MKLSALAKSLGAEVVGEANITGIALDTREVCPGDLFACLPGMKFDGHNLAGDASVRGAAALLVQSDSLHLVAAKLPMIIVENSRATLPRIAAEYFDNPSNELTMVGITGTNGKTTSTKILAAILRAAGQRVGTIGTLGIDLDGEQIESDRTTPEAPALQSTLRKMVDLGGDLVVMEVSSHAICQHRTDSIAFNIAMFTNLTQDHLDYHKTMDAYFQAKATLFTQYPRNSKKKFVSVINIDDSWGRKLVAMAQGRVITYGVDSEADVVGRDITLSIDRSEFTVRTPEGSFKANLGLGGAFQVYNALGATACGIGLGLDIETIRRGISETDQAPGRFESVHTDREFEVVIDYAHTPDGLKNLLQSSRSLNPDRILLVFGCGGDRDTSKRPIMGRLAADLADIAIVTSDNPRTEDPDEIIRQVLVGMDAPHAVVSTEPDRRKAIALALGQAKHGDLVLIAGKGHETYQIVGTKTFPFDDRIVAREVLVQNG